MPGTIVGDNEPMSRAAAPIAGIHQVVPEHRKSIPALHVYLRERVLDGTLAPGTQLSQVGLADQLGVSRTPLREVLRMLQEEGLVDIEPNQRTRVAGFDPEELDHLYASRILLETLALSMTLDRFTAADRADAKKLMATMRQAARSRDIETWFHAHAGYHQLLTAASGDSMQRQLRALADRTLRYIRIYQLSEPGSWQAAGDVEHTSILQAIADRNQDAAQSGLARHLARTALRVLTDCAHDYAPVAVPHAVDLVEGTRSQQIGAS